MSADFHENGGEPHGELQAVIEILKKIYNEKVISYGLFPKHRGQIEHPDGYAKMSSSCGDTAEIFMRVEQGFVLEATFMVEGCTTAAAAAEAGTVLIEGRPLSEARSMTREKIIEELCGLPERDHHLAVLAADTIRAAALDADQSMREPWRKLYRKI